jgi:uncharacterized membrane protein
MIGIKRHLFILIAIIAVLDLAAALVFYHLHLDRDPGPRQQTYVGIWTLLSAVVVAIQLRKIRAERIAAIRAPRNLPTPPSPPPPDAPPGPQPPP